MEKVSTTKHSTILVISIFITLLYSGQVSGVVISVFTDRALWESAVGSFTTETFDDSLLNSGFNVYSQSGGGVSGGLFNDAVFEGSFVEDTIWNFSNPILAFGGNWDLSLNLPGTGLQFGLHGPSDTFGVPGRPDIANTYTGGFWGILADTPFDTVQTFSAGLGSEHYSLDNLVYSKTQIPEPNSLLLLILGLIGLVSFSGTTSKEKAKSIPVTLWI